MHIYLVEVCNGTDNMSAHMAFIVEGLEAAIYSNIGVLLKGWFYTLSGRIAVDPLLYFDQACAVIEFVSYVCSLCGDRADLANKSDLVNFQSHGGKGYRSGDLPGSFHGRPV